MKILTQGMSLSKIRAMSFDMDGVLVGKASNSTPNDPIREVFDAVDHEMISEFLPHLDTNIAQKEARDVFNRTGNTANFYKTCAIDMGLEDPDAFTNKVMTQRIERLWTILSQDFSHMFTPCLRTRKQLEGLKENDVKLGIVTHSHTDIWAIPALELQLSKDIFDSVLGMDIYLQPKSEGPKGYEMSAERLGIPPGEAHAFVEDSWRNLVPIKTAYPKTPTILIGTAPLPEEARPYVDIYTPDLAQVLFAINNHYNPSQPSHETMPIPG
ncbi:MAG: HAD hydrolase-like protein [Rhodospirillales bacterium]|nr:HAD hydrolase-like protein [Rhodospirillales bacterium]MCB9965701.1 HAD hydrolase-like protein [Rhodospirillales bacterium]MCB9980096.1 HAD hydrolase-like protein [Rhodospirillales bacterium]